MAFAYCLVCGGRIYVGRTPWIGQAAFCERCGSDLEVTQVSPLTLDWSDDLADEDWQEERVPDRKPAPA
jgi:lysine biosynthesis protein LysW